MVYNLDCCTEQFFKFVVFIYSFSSFHFNPIWIGYKLNDIRIVFESVHGSYQLVR